jgi:hypothetical protein
MADTMKRNYKISGSGLLCIDGNEITVIVEEKGEFNLADVLSDLNDRPVKFSFSYDEDYEEAEVDADPETGEVI